MNSRIADLKDLVYLFQFTLAQIVVVNMKIATYQKQRAYKCGLFRHRVIYTINLLIMMMMALSKKTFENVHLDR